MATMTADYVSRQETVVERAPERVTTLDWGNSAPLALAAFAVTTFMLSMINANRRRGDHNTGRVRRRADVRRPRAVDRGHHPVPDRQHVFGVLFTGFGAFWMSFFAIGQWFAKDIPALQVGHALGCSCTRSASSSW